MLATLVFSLLGTIVFALIAIGLIYVMAAMGGGQRLQGSRPSPASGASLRPRR